MELKKHIQLLLSSVRIETMDRMMDTVSFSFLTFGTLLRIGISLIFFQALYGVSGSIAGWGINELYILLGTWFIIDGLSWATYTRGFQSRAPRMIENGDLDRLLVLPVNTKIFLSYRFIDIIFTTPSIVAGFLIFLWGATHMAGEMHFFTYTLFLLLAIWIHYSVSVILGAINFYHILEMPMYLRNSIMRLGQYPVSIYHSAVKMVFSFVIPLAFMFSVPAEVFVSGADLRQWGLMISVGIAFHLFSSLLWNNGLKRYESANG